MPYVSIHLFDGNITVLHSVPGPVLCTRDRNESNKLCLPGIHPNRGNRLAVIAQLTDRSYSGGHTGSRGCHITQNSGEGWCTHSSSEKLSQRPHQTGKRLAGGNN